MDRFAATSVEEAVAVDMGRGMPNSTLARNTTAAEPTVAQKPW
jgi:hypothetical protein